MVSALPSGGTSSSTVRIGWVWRSACGVTEATIRGGSPGGVANAVSVGSSAANGLPGSSTGWVDSPSSGEGTPSPTSSTWTAIPVMLS